MKTDQEITESGMQGALEAHKEEEGHKKKAKPESAELKAFLELFQQEENLEEKIRKAISFMRSRLSSTSAPKFREFWEMRSMCLPLFKEALSSKARADLWQQYVDLSVEARRLKEILDEQSAFAYEQIDLAVQALANDLNSGESALQQMPDLPILLEARSLHTRQGEYNQTQKELHFLNALAAKVNALRREVIKTDMRIRSKNKLFDKLSGCGDKIFPRRKELIKRISENFIEDVAQFVAKNFVEGKEAVTPLHILRSEIKTLQAIAKVLTLNTHAFTETRLQLSRSWDQVREWDKEKKKEVEEKKALYQKNLDEFMQEVEAFEAFCAQNECCDEVEAKHQQILQILKGKELGFAEHKIVRDRMNEAKKPHEEKKKQESLASQEREREQAALHMQAVQNLRGSIQALIDQAFSISLEDLANKKLAIEEEYKALSLSKAEKALMDRLFKQLKDMMLDVKSRSLLSLSDDEQSQYAGLKQLLEEKKERRIEIKSQMEAYRKALGGSSLDFEKAMSYRELMDAERKHLEKMNAAIDEIEEKIAELRM
jgi:hypothetical protein